MPDFSDDIYYGDGGFFFYVPSRLMFDELKDILHAEDYKIKLIDDEDDYYIYEVDKK